MENQLKKSKYKFGKNRKRKKFCYKDNEKSEDRRKKFKPKFSQNLPVPN